MSILPRPTLKICQSDGYSKKEVEKINDERERNKTLNFIDELRTGKLSKNKETFFSGLKDIEIKVTPQFRAQITQAYLEDAEFRTFVKNLAKVEVDD